MVKRVIQWNIQKHDAITTRHAPFFIYRDGRRASILYFPVQMITAIESVCCLLKVLHRVGLLACFILLWQHVALIFSSLNLIINQQASILDNKFLHLLDRSTHRSPRRPRTITDRTRRRRLANIGSARNRGTLRRPSYRLERTLALHRSSPTMTLCPSG